MGTQKHLDIKFFCPLSGVEIDGQVIPAHRMAVMQCANGVLFARCPNHVARCFIADFTTVRNVMDKAVVLQITDRTSRKERKNGQTQERGPSGGDGFERSDGAAS